MREESYEITDNGTTLVDRLSGARYHVSLFHEALERVAREAYRLGRMDENAAVRQAMSAGYNK